MKQGKRWMGTILLSGAILIPATMSGCAAHVRYYDSYHRDYHHWDAHEDHAYHMWLSERHYEYRDFGNLNAEQQREYWNWRHTHPDAGR